MQQQTIIIRRHRSLSWELWQSFLGIAPTPFGLDSRALRHLRKTGRRMSRRNYRQACKSVGRAR